jgi:pentatricopeptide repeat protein
MPSDLYWHLLVLIPPTYIHTKQGWCLRSTTSLHFVFFLQVIAFLCCLQCEHRCVIVRNWLKEQIKTKLLWTGIHLQPHMLQVQSDAEWLYTCLNGSVPGLKPDIVMMNSIISAAAKIGDLKTAEKVFQQALEAGDMTFKIRGRSHNGRMPNRLDLDPFWTSNYI